MPRGPGRLDRATLRRLPASVVALGFVSFWMDVSSEMIHALLPIYLVSGMGASMLAVGMIEGIAEATASITKVFSGALSDRLGKRKPLTVIGYGLAALTKPVFPLAPSIGWLVGARFVDRVGKGIRGAPRDALIADLSPADLRGASFGLRQTLDTAGAVIGPLVAVALMAATGGDIPLVFWAATLPAIVAVWLLVTRVNEPERRATNLPRRIPLAPNDMKRLGAAFWGVIAVAALFALARFSEAFLLLRAHDAGLSAGLVPLVLVGMSLSYTLSAYPAGVLSDGGDRMGVLAIGVAFLIAADLVLGLVPGLTGIGLGAALWGLHMGFTQGIFASLVADTAPEELRGTAFGVLNLLTGLATLGASVLAGILWDWSGPRATFLVGAGLATAALVGLAPLRRLLAPAAKAGAG